MKNSSQKIFFGVIFSVICFLPGFAKSSDQMSNHRNCEFRDVIGECVTRCELYIPSLNIVAVLGLDRSIVFPPMSLDEKLDCIASSLSDMIIKQNGKTLILPPNLYEDPNWNRYPFWNPSWDPNDIQIIN